jgi:hypothetical protein
MRESGSMESSKDKESTIPARERSSKEYGKMERESIG